MAQFNPTNYPIISPALDDTLLIRQTATGRVRSVAVSAVANAASAIQSVSSIAALKGITVDDLSDGAPVLVGGYYEDSDGGGGTYYYSSSSAVADNGGTIIEPSVGDGRWLMYLPDPVVMVEQFGAVGDGTTDDAAAINAALVYIASIGGGTVKLRGKTYAVKSIISNAYDSVELVGTSATWKGPWDAPPPQENSTVLKYTGAGVIDCVVYSGSPVGTTADLHCVGTNVINIMADGGGLAVSAFKIVSAYRSTYDNLLAYNSTGYGFLITCLSNTQIGPTPDTQQCIFSRLSADMRDGSNSDDAHGIFLTSYNPMSTEGNVSLNTFIQCQTYTRDGAGWVIMDADTNSFIGVSATSVNYTLPGFWILGYFSNSGNTFQMLTSPPTNGIVLSGTATVIPAGFPGAGGGAMFPFNNPYNMFIGLDRGNGTPLPVCDPGCEMTIISTLGNVLAAPLTAPYPIRSSDGTNSVAIKTVAGACYMGTETNDDLLIIHNDITVATLTAAGLQSTNIGQGTAARGKFTRLNPPVSTVVGLESAATAGKGAIAYVTDANATTRFSIVVGGGANEVPVHSNGTDWLIS
jgi:hypothetical protein